MTLNDLADRAEQAGGLIHWVSADPNGTGNITACGKAHVFPMRGNGWRVRDITCPDCDRAIVDRLARARASQSEAS